MERVGNVEPRPQRLDEERFVEGLLASLYLSGVYHVITRKNEHQKAFDRVAELVHVKRDQADLTAQEMPLLIPAPFSGTYNEFDTGLIQLQAVGITRCNGPFFVDVTITLNEERAQNIVDEFSEPQRQLLSELALAYINPPEN